MQLTKAMDDSKLTLRHWWIWLLAAMGIFLDGFDLFIIAVGLPLIAREFSTSPEMLGLIGAAAPLGCIIGASIFGRFTDKIGRKALLLIDLLFFVIFAGCSAFAPNETWLIFFRFLVGVGVGADYPVSSTYITENMPKRLRGRMLVSGFGFQALGALAGALVGYAVLKIHPELNAWRWMLGIAVVPAIIVLILRLWLPESPRWLVNQGKHEQATQLAEKMTGTSVRLEIVNPPRKGSFFTLFTPTFLKRTILTSLSWFLMDIALYGIGFFTPVILSSILIDHSGSFINQDLNSAKGAAFLDLFWILGILVAMWLVEKWGRVKLQTLGFFGMAIGLFIFAGATSIDNESIKVTMVFIGFIVFYFMSNMGPNPMTFLLPAEVFPTYIRATGHGFASACGKIGAAIGIFLLPILKASIGLFSTSIFLGLTALIGFGLTAMLGYETKGRSLEELESIETQMSEAEEGLITVQDDIRRLNSDIKRVEGALAKAIQEMRRARQ
jgi:MFS family permease